VFLTALGGRSRYLGFDMGFTKELDWRRTRAAALINETLVPGALRLVMGDSRDTVPALFARESLRCDLLALDGDHSVGAIARDYDAFSAHLADGAPVLFDDVGRDFVERGDKALFITDFLLARRRQLKLVGCVRLPGVFDGEMIQRVLHDGSDEAKRNRSLARLVASDGFCIAQKVAGLGRGRGPQLAL
jgi:hypothetical protein